MKPKRVFLVFAGLVAGVATLLTAQLAFAHSRPIRFDPPPGSVLTAAPAKIDGWFGSEIRRDPNWSFIHVADAQGARVDSGDVTLSTDRRQMSVALKSGLTNGIYTVTWRTFDDSDGAIFGDCYTFFVGQAAADQAVTNKLRLDGGGSCQRIDVEAKNGTPVPGSTPAAAAGGSDDDSADMAGGSDSDSDSGIPIWGLAVGIVAGIVVGGVGGRLLGKKS